MEMFKLRAFIALVTLTHMCKDEYANFIFAVEKPYLQNQLQIQ